jgi:hypothetical protein
MASLAEIRAKLKEQESRGSDNNTRSGGDNSIYPFWNLKEGQESVVRFLPDANPDNTFFWVERAMIKLPFNGIKGDTDNKQVQVQVPCVEMYNDGSVCPILSEVRGWFKDKSLEDMGRKYWKKRSYIFQGYVVEDGLKEEQKPENAIRRFIIGPQIFQLIRGALLDPEMDNLPTDILHGVDFKLIKTSKGGYADYSTSSWKRRERPLSDSEQDNLKAHGLFNLNDFLPKKPTEIELKVMKEMFEASVDGEPYDMERWGQYFKPAGMGQATGDPNKASAPRAETRPATSYPAPSRPDTSALKEESAPWEDDVAAAEATMTKPAAAPAATGGRAEDILAMIRNRKTQ